MERLEGRRLAAAQQSPLAALPVRSGFADHQLDAALAGREVAEPHRRIGRYTGRGMTQGARSQVVVAVSGQALRPFVRRLQRRDLRVEVALESGEPLTIDVVQTLAEGEPKDGVEIIGAV